MTRGILAIAVVMLVAGCSQKHPDEQPATQRPTVVQRRDQVAPKPRPTIDPKSTEAAEDLVSGLVALINSGKLNDAYMLFGPNAPPRADFDRELAPFSHVTQGAAGDQDGAAGSIYVSIPLTFTGPKGSRRRGTVVLRRVNDVPGSTEAQRRWHIERLDWDQPPST
jgi:hypothetical protein